MAISMSFSASFRQATSGYTRTSDGSHLAAAAYPLDLMNDTLAPSTRKLPSTLDVQIIDTVHASAADVAASRRSCTPSSGILRLRCIAFA